MEYKKGELLYVCRKGVDWISWNDGVFVLYRDEYEGNVDLSYHGSSWYEKFIVCEHLDSRQRVVFGNQTYHWCSAKEYIQSMQNKLEKIKSIVGGF